MLGQQPFGFGLIEEQQIRITRLERIEIEPRETLAIRIQIGDARAMAEFEKRLDEAMLFEAVRACAPGCRSRANSGVGCAPCRSDAPECAHARDSSRRRAPLVPPRRSAPAPHRLSCGFSFGANMQFSLKRHVLQCTPLVRGFVCTVPCACNRAAMQRRACAAHNGDASCRDRPAASRAASRSPRAACARCHRRTRRPDGPRHHQMRGHRVARSWTAPTRADRARRRRPDVRQVLLGCAACRRPAARPPIARRIASRTEAPRAVHDHRHDDEAHQRIEPAPAGKQDHEAAHRDGGGDPGVGGHVQERAAHVQVLLAAAHEEPRREAVHHQPDRRDDEHRRGPRPAPGSAGAGSLRRRSRRRRTATARHSRATRESTNCHSRTCSAPTDGAWRATRRPRRATGRGRRRDCGRRRRAARSNAR